MGVWKDVERTGLGPVGQVVNEASYLGRRTEEDLCLWALRRNVFLFLFFPNLYSARGGHAYWRFMYGRLLCRLPARVM